MRRFIAFAIVASAIVASAIACGLSPAGAQEQGEVPKRDLLYQSYFQADGQFSNEFDLGRGSLVLPFSQTDETIWFADLRSMWLNPSTYEGNAGLGFRHIRDDGWIFGSHVWFDRRRTELDNWFSQVTVGVEWLDVNWDIRANGYIPTTDGKALSAATTMYDGSTIRILRAEEVAYHGADAELGYLVAGDQDGNIELRIYGGGFYFDHSETSQPIAGGRARAELRLFDLAILGEGSRVMIGAEYQHDDVRGDISSALVSLRIPLNSRFKQRRPDRLQRRMLEPIVRDLDIVANQVTRNEAAIDVETGGFLGPLKIIDASTGDLQGTIDSAGNGGLIIADGTAGQINTATSLALQPGQILRGAGFEIRGAETGTVLTLGSRPAFLGTDGAQDVLVAADNSIIRDVDISGGRHGIYADGITGFQMYGNAISSVSQSGIHLATSASGTVRDNVISGNALGIEIDSWTDGMISGNTISGNGSNGISITELVGGSIDTNTLSSNGGHGILISTMQGGTVTGNAASNNAGSGYLVSTLNDGTVTANTAAGNTQNGFVVSQFLGGALTGNQSRDNGQDGYLVDFVDFNVGNMPEISGNLAENNVNGFHFVVLDGGDVTGNIATANSAGGFLVDTFDFGTFAGNTATANQGNGITVTNFTVGSIRDNIATGNTLSGLHIETMSNGGVRNNTLSDNLLHGLTITTFGNGQVTDNLASGNAFDGFHIPNYDFGLLTDNTATANQRDGFYFSNFTFGARSDGNIADGNGGDGFDIGTGGVWSDAELINSTSTNNAGFGYRITNRISGTATNNVASGNADNTLP